MDEVKERWSTAEPHVCDEAKRLTQTDRRSVYPPPRDDFTRVGRMWAAILDLPEPVPPRVVGLMMIAVKISRETHRHKRDSVVDIAGYAACIQEIEEGNS